MTPREAAAARLQHAERVLRRRRRELRFWEFVMDLHVYLRTPWFALRGVAA